MENIFEKITLLEKEAETFGFQWEEASQILAQIRSELDEILVHLKDGDQSKLQEEIGDLLHATFSLCVFCKFNPEETLLKSVNKFAQRLKAVKEISKAQGLSNLHGKSFDELMEIWRKAKNYKSS